MGVTFKKKNSTEHVNVIKRVLLRYWLTNLFLLTNIKINNFVIIRMSISLFGIIIILLAMSKYVVVE